MSEQRIVVDQPDYAAGAWFVRELLDLIPVRLDDDVTRDATLWAVLIVDAALAGARIVELPDMEKLREAVDSAWWQLHRVGIGRAIDAAARWVLSLESE